MSGHTSWVRIRHIRGAQHKRPGRTARRERQALALEGLLEIEQPNTSEIFQITTLQKRLGLAPTYSEPSVSIVPKDEPVSETVPDQPR